jgi:protocatechuate 3,4-dioxygenase beta subunit
MEDLSRRRFLHLGAMTAGLVVVPTAAWACTPAASAENEAGKCAVTEDNIEGPYYRAGAPLRANLVEGDVTGVPLVITGRVLSLDCRSPLSDAELDIWQADGNGHYDNDGSLAVPASRFRLRGRVRPDRAGAFELRTVVPGRYLNGRVYRPSHIHAKIRAPGHRALTTQLYFPDDPYNKVDPFIRRSLIMDVSGPAERKSAHFDFVLAPA